MRATESAFGVFVSCVESFFTVWTELGEFLYGRKNRRRFGVWSGFLKRLSRILILRLAAQIKI